MNVYQIKRSRTLSRIRTLSTHSTSRVRESNEELEKKYRKLAVKKQKILDRNKKKVRVDPLKASEVIRKYIIPMLKEKLKKEQEEKRKGIKSKAKIISLNDVLRKKVAECRLEIKKLGLSLDRQLKENEVFKGEIEEYKKKIEKFIITKSLNVEFNALKPESVTRPERYFNKVAIKSLELKVALSSIINQKHLMTERTSQENISNYVLKLAKFTGKSAKLEALISHTIIGNHLHSAYNTMIFFPINFNLLNSVFSSTKLKLYNKIKMLDKTKAELESIFPELPELLENVFNKNYLYRSQRKRNKVLRIQKVDQITLKVQQLSNLNFDVSKLEEELNRKKEIFDKFMVEYTATRDVIIEKQNSLNRSEFICQFCHETYKELDNFNWSCIRHTSLWSGEIYWCCGSTDKNSEGCFKTKHVPEENEDEKEKLGINNEFCLTCMKQGHNFKRCLKDPNFFVKKFKSKSQNNIRAKIKLGNVKNRPFEEIEKLKISLHKNE